MNLEEIFYEAYRRRVMFHKNEPLETAWLGLGTKSGYRVALKNQYMTWISEPTPRTTGWLKLTNKGVQEFQKRLLENQKRFQQEFPEQLDFLLFA